jgi:hypothetical protein
MLKNTSLKAAVRSNLINHKGTKDSTHAISFESYHIRYTLAGFDLTTHSSNLLCGRRRRFHWTKSPGPTDAIFFCTANKSKHCFVGKYQSTLFGIV